MYLKDGGDESHAKAITSVLGLCIGKLAQANSDTCAMVHADGAVEGRCQLSARRRCRCYGTLPRRIPFGKSGGSWQSQLDAVIRILQSLPDTSLVAHVVQADARKAGSLVLPELRFSSLTRRTSHRSTMQICRTTSICGSAGQCGRMHSDLFATMATPKEAELTANPARYGGSREKARSDFIKGFTDVFYSLKKATRPDLPMVVAYAHKQDEEMVDGVTSTGWESLLEAVLAAGLGVVRTWPVEAAHQPTDQPRANALASYVILICKPRQARTWRSPIGEGFLDALERKAA